MKYVAVGSKNAAKVRAAELGVQAYWPAAEVCGFDVPSGVSDQPATVAETIQGASNRAQAAFQAAKSAGNPVDLALGMEAAVVEMAGQPIMYHYIAVTDGTQTYVVPGTGTPVPATWAAALQQGEELRPHIIASGMAYDHQAGATGMLTKGVMNRDEIFANTIKNALVPWVNATLFQPENADAA